MWTPFYWLWHWRSYWLWHWQWRSPSKRLITVLNIFTTVPCLSEINKRSIVSIKLCVSSRAKGLCYPHSSSKRMWIKSLKGISPPIQLKKLTWFPTSNRCHWWFHCFAWTGCSAVRGKTRQSMRIGRTGRSGRTAAWLAEQYQSTPECKLRLYCERTTSEKERSIKDGGGGVKMKLDLQDWKLKKIRESRSWAT